MTLGPQQPLPGPEVLDGPDETDQSGPPGGDGRGPTGPLVVTVALGLVAAVTVVAAALVLPGLLREEPPDLSAVIGYEDLSTTHVEDDVRYDQVPPAGGPHLDRWLECGVYDSAVRDENAVHGLEHGVVWITYAPGLDADGVDRLAAALPDEGYLSPYPDLPAPVVVTVWGRQIHLTGPDDPRLGLFLAEYGDGGTAPEPMAGCHGGVEAYAEGARILV